MNPSPSWLSRLCLSLTAGAALLVAGCDGSGKATTDAGAGGSTGSTGAFPSGVVLGPLDSHCNGRDGGQNVQEIGVCLVDDPSAVPANKATCGLSFSQDAGTATGGDGGRDAGAAAGGHAGDGGRDARGGADADVGSADSSDYGPTLYGSAANDDDCKYFISWVATPIQQNTDTYFTVTAIRLADGKPASCAGIRPDISLSLTHGVPAPRDPAVEVAPGVYKVGPIRFDTAGNTPGHYWTVRFHLYEECSDSREDSPHGHVAFYVKVP